MKREMKLIAIYIGKFGVFSDEILNFSSDYTVRRAALPGDKISLLIKYEKKLPAKFFSSDPSKGGCVSSVSAIIGKNGTGKTMIARLFCTMVPPARHLKKNKIVLICELGGKPVVYTSCERDKIVVTFRGESIADIHDLTNESMGFPSAFPFKFFYYSPHYTTEQYDWDMGDNGDAIFNISTTWLMKHPERHSEPLLPDVSPLTIYDMDEKLRVLGFCHAYERVSAKESTGGRLKNPLRDFSIPLPQGISISPLFAGMRQARDEMEGYIAACHQERNNRQKEKRAGSEQYPILEENTRKCDIKVGKYLDELRRFWNASDANQDFVTKVFVFYVARYLLECGLMEAHSPSFPPSRELQDGSYYLMLKDFILAHDWSKAVPSEDIINFLDKNPPPVLIKANHSNGDTKNTSAPRDLFECLTRLCKLIGKKDATGKRLVQSDVDGSLVCQSQNKQIGKLVYSLVELHAQTIIFSPFLSFNIIPKMSSGEMAFLSMFARIRHFIFWNTNSGDNVVLFLDEAETTLHPEWQRRLVDYFIRFFEVFIPGRHYHLVFASHSPILLSDIPSGNCCFLKTNGGDKKSGEEKRSRCLKFLKDGDNINTFGANIYDLYRGAFYHKRFFSDGAIGEFSSRIIERYLRKIAEDSMNEQKTDTCLKNAYGNDIALLQELIGDRLLVRYFRMLQERSLE